MGCDDYAVVCDVAQSVSGFDGHRLTGEVATDVITILRMLIRPALSTRRATTFGLGRSSSSRFHWPLPDNDCEGQLGQILRRKI